MKSKTKTILTDSQIREILNKAGIKGEFTAKPLGAGMFNSVYEIAACGKSYVLKTAPENGIKVMTYEKNMLSSELFWYDVIRKNTDIRVPEIFFSMKADEKIPADCFIMEKLDGVTRDKIRLDSEFKIKSTAQMAAKIHNIKSEKFGYIQNGLFDDWYQAYCSMAENLIKDAEAMGKKTSRGMKVLDYASQYKSVLEAAPCTAVNYDIWDSNIICSRSSDGAISMAWIDPERSMWADPVMDFICLEGFAQPLEKKKKSIKYHNEISNVKIELNRESKIRLAFAYGLGAMIMEIERYYRFKPFSQGWFVDISGSKMMYNTAFKVLENEK